MHETFPGAAFGVAVFEVPARGFEGGAAVGRGGGIVWGGAEVGWGRVIVMASVFGAEVVLLVADHISKAVSCWKLAFLNSRERGKEHGLKGMFLCNCCDEFIRHRLQLRFLSAHALSPR